MKVFIDCVIFVNHRVNQWDSSLELVHFDFPQVVLQTKSVISFHL